MSAPQLFGQLSYTTVEDKSLEFVFTDVTASIISMNGIDLNGEGVLTVDKLSSFRVFVSTDTAARMGEMDIEGVSVEDKQRLDFLQQRGISPVLRDKHLIKITRNDEPLYGETELKPCETDASGFPSFFRKILGSDKLLFKMMQCSELECVPDMLRAVQENGMENLAWVSVYKMEGIIGTINDEWYIAPSSYGLLGLEGSIIKLDDAYKLDSWPKVEDAHAPDL